MVHSAVAGKHSIIVHILINMHASVIGTKKGISGAGKVQFFTFIIFEVMVGMFWPSMMKMRSQYVPEDLRSTLINFFRIPLNLFVCAVLYNVSIIVKL